RLPFFHVDPREMRQHREHPEAVIDDHGVAGEVEIARADHASPVRRLDGGAGRAQKIGPAVRTSRLAIEDTARAEGAVGLAWNRTDERHGPEPLRRRSR